MEVRISIPERNHQPKEGEVKHVEFVGEDERDYRFGYKKLEDALFFKCLECDRPNFHDQIMIVTFNTQMQEQANIAFCKRILKSGIFCDKKRFNFLGHSDIQLERKTCYMMNDSEDEIQKHLKRFGDIVEERNVSVRAKKIGLSFSPFLQQVELTKEQCDEISKVKKSGYGFMSRVLASKIWKAGFLQGLNYPEPSALLVHYQGSQGMLILNEDDDLWLWQDQLDESMRKPTIPGGEVYILDYSQPNTNAYLDAKLIILLAARGVQVENLRTLQRAYYSLLEDMMRNDKASIDYFMQLTGRTTEEEVATLLRSEVSYVVEQESSGSEVPHVRILIPKARLVFGVRDPYGKLTCAQCYFRPTLLYDQQEEFKTEKKVFAAPSPCYYPGDIQVLELIHDKEGYETLKDCLVLPASLAFKCGGAGLSGNKFIVCWDRKLIPKRKVEPISYKLTSFEIMSHTFAKWRSYFQNSPKTTKDLREELIDHFATFKDDLPIQIDRTYMSLAAKESGLSQMQCEQLSRMFYQATNSMVDKEVLWKKLEELSDESGTARGAGESSTETTNLLDDVEGEEKWEELRTNRGESSGGLLSYCTCNLLQRDGEFHVNGKILNDFKKEATRFSQKANNMSNQDEFTLRSADHKPTKLPLSMKKNSDFAHPCLKVNSSVQKSGGR